LSLAIRRLNTNPATARNVAAITLVNWISTPVFVSSAGAEVTTAVGTAAGVIGRAGTGADVGTIDATADIVNSGPLPFPPCGGVTDVVVIGHSFGVGGRTVVGQGFGGCGGVTDLGHGGVTEGVGGHGFAIVFRVGHGGLVRLSSWTM
jgi:hypothetical protein